MEEAITFEPVPPQKNLKPINLYGREDFHVDPRTQDVFNHLVNLRDDAPKPE